MSRYVCYSVCFSIFGKNSKVKVFDIFFLGSFFCSGIVVGRFEIVPGRLKIVVDRCGSLWIVVGRCGIVVGRCGSLWVVPGFSN